MIPLENWGKDHWSTFAYAETLAVDNNGTIIPELSRMRTNIKKQQHLWSAVDGSKYPTILRDGSILQGHDDWDCLEDAVENGLLTDTGTGTYKAYQLTEEGRKVADLLRKYKSLGGKFKDFSEWLESEATRCSQ